MTEEEREAINDAKKICQYGFFVSTGKADYDSRRLSLLINVLNRTETERDQLKTERDAAIEDLRRYPGITPCHACKHFIAQGVLSEFCTPQGRQCFEWRGIVKGG